MPLQHPPECEARIKVFSKDILSQRAIVRKFAANGFIVDRKYVSNVLKNVGIKRREKAVRAPPPRKGYPRSA